MMSPKSSAGRQVPVRKGPATGDCLPLSSEFPFRGDCHAPAGGFFSDNSIVRPTGRLARAQVRGGRGQVVGARRCRGLGQGACWIR